jgi:omega-amidase
MSTLSITTIQTSLAWEDKAANLSMLEKKVRSLQGRHELVVLPEMFSTGFSMNPVALAETMDGPTVRWMKSLAAEKRIVLTGSVIIQENDQYFNRLLWVLPNGEMGQYDKRHLFAYAGEHEQYTPGSKRLIASLKGWKINLQICYDLRFPVWARQSESSLEQVNIPPDQRAGSSAEYDLLVYVANWPERRVLAWKTLLQARAIENQAYVVGVNRVGNDGNNIYHSGETMIVDPMGEVLYSKAHDEEIFTLEIDKNTLSGIRNKLPFLDDADEFLIQA